MKPLITKLLRESLIAPNKDFKYNGYECKLPFIENRNAYGCSIYENNEYRMGVKGWLTLEKAKVTAIEYVNELLERQLMERTGQDLEVQNAKYEALFDEGNKYFPGIKMANQVFKEKEQMMVFIPSENRWTTIGGFEVHLAGAKIKKIAEWLYNKKVPIVWSKTTNSIYLHDEKRPIRISDHRKGKHEGVDILVRWNTPLLEVMNAVFDLIKMR